MNYIVLTLFSKSPLDSWKAEKMLSNTACEVTFATVSSAKVIIITKRKKK